MIADILTVARKELKEVLTEGAGRGKLNLLFMFGVFGVFIPLQSGRQWIESPAMPLFWVWMPIFLVIGVVADSFAGERERHTLETLLASRLPDRAILFGKMAASVLYGFGFAAISLIIGIVAINVTDGQDDLLIYPAGILLALNLVYFFGAAFMASLGAVVSLRASSMKQAQQGLMVAVVILVMPLSLIPLLLPGDMRNQFFETLFNADMTGIMFLVAAVLAVLTVILTAVTMARFKRARLILD